MPARYNVLFLSNENSDRSIFAEALLNHKGRNRFQAYSAGAKPTGFIYPQTLRQLELVHLPTAGLRSKGLAEFSKSGAPTMDFVFAICDETAREACPAWPGWPVTGDWNVPNPILVKGNDEEIEHAFREVFGILQARIDLLVNLRAEGLRDFSVRRHRQHKRAA